MPTSSDTTPEKPKKRILIIEDDNAIASIYCDKFAREGFLVSYAADGEEGLKIAQELRPQIILLDIRLPKMDGLLVLKELKQNSSTLMIPVIVWTNLSEVEEEAKARALGAVDYLVKINHMPSEVVQKVRQRLGERV